MKLLIIIPMLLATTYAKIYPPGLLWGQCGGLGYTGPTSCSDGSTCVSYGYYYSLCEPPVTSTSSIPSVSSTSTSAKATSSGCHIACRTPRCALEVCP